METIFTVVQWIDVPSQSFGAFPLPTCSTKKVTFRTYAEAVAFCDKNRIHTAEIKRIEAVS